MYDGSARLANRELSHWIKAHNIKFPLFTNMYEQTDINAKPPKFCIGVMTARRVGAPLNSISQLVTALLARMDPCKDRSDFYIHVFNVDENPGTFFEVKEIEHLVPITVVKNKQYTAKHRKHQETLDYIAMMRILHEFGCPYATIIEDDALPDEHWTDKMRDAAARLEKLDDWILTRLFTDMRETPLAVLDTQVPQHGTPAMMFNRKYLLKIAADVEKDLLEKLPTDQDIQPKDLILAELLQFYNISQFAYYPVIFQHTGVFSSVQDRTMDETLGRFPAYSKFFDSHGLPVVFYPQRWTACLPANKTKYT
jgi:hypothetical protein